VSKQVYYCTEQAINDMLFVVVGGCVLLLEDFFTRHEVRQLVIIFTMLGLGIGIVIGILLGDVHYRHVKIMPSKYCNLLTIYCNPAKSERKSVSSVIIN